jgi:hypothetical protein
MHSTQEHSILVGVCDQSEHEEELKELKVSLQDTQPVGALLNACR